MGKFFFTGQVGVGRGKAKNVQGGAGRVGEYTAYTSWLKSHAIAKEILIHIASSEVSQIYSTFMIFIVNTIREPVKNVLADFAR